MQCYLTYVIIHNIIYMLRGVYITYTFVRILLSLVFNFVSERKILERFSIITSYLKAIQDCEGFDLSTKLRECSHSYHVCTRRESVIGGHMQRMRAICVYGTACIAVHIAFTWNIY